MKVIIDIKVEKMPDFLVVGAAKSGTSSLHYYLQAHPQIFMPKSVKETLFFFLVNRPNHIDRQQHPHAVDNLKDYIALFEEATDEQVLGEATPHYLGYADECISNIKAQYPNYERVKIIIVLRNPVEKVISQYKMLRDRLGVEPLSLSDALAAEEERRKNPKYVSSFNYVESSRYAHQVKAYLDNFPNTKIFFYDDLKAKPRQFLTNILDFLEVDSGFVPQNLEQVYNQAALKPKSKVAHFLKKNVYEPILQSSFLKATLNMFVSEQKLQTMKNSFKQKFEQQFLQKAETKIEEETVEELKAIFREDILLLEKYLNKDLKHWL
ncbi:MAG: sulfotransferase family protein [Chitinophagales bacterium]